MATKEAPTIDFAGQVIANCPRCRVPVLRPADAAFCPRCGAAVVAQLPSVEQMTVQTPTHTIAVLEPIGEGDSSRVYRCEVRSRATGAAAAWASVFKVAKRAAANDALRSEATTLHLLHFAEGSGPFQAFMPRCVESFGYVDESRETRRATVLAYDPAVATPGSLYTLAEVRAAYPDGVSQRHAAWMFRRVLNVLAFAHGAGVGHGAVTPAHVLIEPKHHGVVLVGWGHAGGADVSAPLPLDPLAHAWQPYAWPRREADVALAARTFAWLMGGDPVTLQTPKRIDAGLVRFLERCAFGRDVSGSRGAGQLLADFDKLIVAMWGKRSYQPFAMPSRAY